MSAADLPAPLVPAEVDLRDFAFMPLDVRTLLTSSLWIKAKKDPRVAHAAVSLWCECWHQVPASSLPDDDEVLAELARCDEKEWRRIRERALLHFVKCSDGRLYHRHVASKAHTAWAEKQAQRKRTAAATAAREAKRKAEQEALDVQRRDDRHVARDVARDVDRDVHQGRVKGQGEGQGQGEGLRDSEAIASGAAAPPPAARGGEVLTASPPAPAPGPGADASPVDVIFALGLPLLAKAGVPEKQARSFLGLLRKDAKGRGGDPFVVAALDRCIREQSLQPVEFLRGCFKAPAPGAGQPDLDLLTAGVQRQLGISPDRQEVIDA